MDWRGWIARKLLSWANKIDDRGVVCDAEEGWYFKRQWKQPHMDGCRKC